MNKRLSFKVHTANLLKEITESALPKSCGVLFQPINIFRQLLLQVAHRASQINDPVLNKLMCDLTLYEVADIQSTEYDKETVEKINKLAQISVQS